VITTIDFETEAIEPYPAYPPKPVGLSIWYEGTEKPTYLAWGHPSGNNCTHEEAKRQLASIWDGELLMHNARFDMEVARVFFDLPYPKDVLRVHDTLFLNFLYDAHADSLSLKPSAERILGIPPDEQDALRQYLGTLGYISKDWGAHISKAPGDVVAPYANGDTIRTRALFDALLDHVNKQGMTAAYRREQRLAPILSANEAEGIRIDLPKLQFDLNFWEGIYGGATDLLLSYIGDCNPDSAADLGRALVSSGRAKEEDFLRTPTGKMSTSKESIDKAVKDPELVQILQYRGQLKTLLTTFMRPWEKIGSICNGRLHPQFNQVRGDVYGTRTGRLSSSNPNFQNVPKEFKGVPPANFPSLPLMREYILPDEGEILVASDFNGQEMRIAAHFAEGRAAEIYQQDPRADFHQVVSELLKSEAGLDLPRGQVKAVGFALIYGSGVTALAAQLGVDRSTASRIKQHYFDALPGFEELMQDVSERGRLGKAVKTWGGRYIYAEKPKMVGGQRWTFEYKLLNHLIQGSAADQTKEAVNTTGYKTPHRRFLITVHDENVYSVKPTQLAPMVDDIKSSMEDQAGWDVPFKAEVKCGYNWHNMTKYEDFEDY
jgi:DNA polymerase I-like protein with 3'-5' exonuclease and polymerase domains